MANHGYVYTKQELTDEQLMLDLEEINNKFLGGLFTISNEDGYFLIFNENFSGGVPCWISDEREYGEYSDPEDSSTYIEYDVPKIIFKDIKGLTEKIENELNKCSILCRNCHMFEHSEIDFYIKYEKEILEKVETLAIYNKKIDKSIIKKMYFDDGMKQIDIVKKLGSKRSTISEAIKQIKKEM